MIDEKALMKIEKEALDRYNKRFDQLGVSPKTLGWGCREDQLERFNTICQHCKLENKTVMDIGCGFADLYCYLKEHDVRVNYIGIDINPYFIDYCKRAFPEQQFHRANIMLKHAGIPKADIVIALGLLNFRLNEISNRDYTEMFIQKAFALTNERLIVDFLSEYRIPHYPKEDFVFYHSPESVFQFAMSLTDNACIIHDYKEIPQKEFMLILNK